MTYGMLAVLAIWLGPLLGFCAWVLFWETFVPTRWDKDWQLPVGAILVLGPFTWGMLVVTTGWGI